MVGLNDVIISKHRVRAGVYALKLQNGGIQIGEELYLDYSLKDAMKLWRNKNPVR